MAQSEGFSRGGFSSGRGGFNQPTSNDNQSNSGFASRGSFGQSTDNDQESSGFASRGGGRGRLNSGRGGGFGQSNDNKENSGFSSRGGFASRGSFGQSNDSQENSGFSSRGAFASRGSFGQSTDNNQENTGFASRGGFGSRGSFGQSNDNNQESSGFGSARGGGRGGSNSGRGGGFGQSNDSQENSGFSSRGGFASRGSFGQSTDNNQENTGFASRGGFGSRGSFGQSTDNNQENSGFASRGGGRGGSNSGRGGGFGQSNDNKENSGFSSRGGFASRGSFGQSNDSQENSGFSSRGSFGQSNDNNQESSGFSSTRVGGRGGRGGGFGQSNDNKENSGFSSRGSFGQSTDNNQENTGFASRGGFGPTRGSFGQSTDNNQDDASRGGGRGGFSARGSFGQSNEETSAFGSNRGRGGFNQNGAGGRTCYKCQGEGHMARECPNADSAGGGFSQNGNTGGRICYKCQENGHTARECPNAESANGNAEAGTEGGNTQQINRAGGETLPERAPINFVPQARKVDELFSEDQQAAKEYADVVDHDEEVVTENFSGAIVRIQKWEEAEFEPQLLTNIKERSKYSRPRKIQGATIPFVLDGFDIKSQAETGSGKTAAFVLPIIDACLKAKTDEGEGRYDSELASPFAIIIAPSRELVMQVFEQAEKFAVDTGISVAKAYGQYNICRNHAEIRSGCDILVATPGRLKQFVTNGEIRCNKLKFLVLDEADRLLDQNFSGDIMDIVNTSGFPAIDNRQTLLFSATFPPEMAIFADQLLKKDAVFVTNRRNNPNKRIKQDFIVCDRLSNLDKLCELLLAEAEKAGGVDKIRRTLVFINTKPMCDMAAIYLCQRGIRATSIHGDRGQHLREQALSEFRNHKVSVLCATDVCARGIDVKQLDHVINMNLPPDATTYIHRIGRTGRIAKGWSTTFVQGGEPLLNEIAEMLRENNEEVPETLKSAIGGIGDGATSSGFSAQTSSATNAQPAAAPSTLPVKTAAPTTTPAATSSAAPVKTAAVSVADYEDDW